jgi:hypothetical protein
MRKMRKFADGGSDKYKAKFDRKVADIESDYKKAQARKTGRAAEVAKAKYEQRMADARDDLAKWTKSDRTQTRAAEKAAERELTMTRRYGSNKPKMEDKPLATPKGPSEAEMAKMSTMAPASKSQTFKEAFRAAYERGDKTFKWDGKPGVTFTTAMAGEKKPASRPAPRSTAATPPAKAAAATRSAPGKAPASTAKAAAATPPPKTTSASTAKAAPAKSPGLYEKDASGSWKDNSSAARLTRTGDALTLGLTALLRNSKNDRPNAYSGMTNYYRNKEKKEAEAKAAARRDSRLAQELVSSGRKPETPALLRASAKGGSVKGYAKGGSIDGCAVRGKTKAMRKK